MSAPREESALTEQAERLDGVRPDRIRLDVSEISAAVHTLLPEVRSALEESIDRVRQATKAQLPTATVTRLGPGAEVIQRWSPVSRVGLYVPGGKARCHPAS